jgi:hypothetical protein
VNRSLEIRSHSSGLDVRISKEFGPDSLYDHSKSRTQGCLATVFGCVARFSVPRDRCSAHLRTDANGVAYANPHRDSYPHTDVYPYAERNAHLDANAHCNRNADGDAHNRSAGIDGRSHHQR